MKMNIFKILLVIMILSFSSFFAHLCHDPLKPEKPLILIPEKEQISIEESGKFRIYIENTFDSILNDVKLFVKSDAFDIEVKPSIIEKLFPGERTFFLLQLKLRKGFSSGNYPLKISVEAKSAELRPSKEMIDVIVEKKQEEPVLPVEEVKPEKIIPPVEESEKTIPPVKEPIVKEVRPQEEVVETTPEEEYSEDVGEMVVKVEKKPFWKKPYFYLILILFLIAILIWRKLRQGR